MISENDKIECRKTQLRLLNEFKRICDESGLIYWIDFGTLLGATRHKGFIPWDDDLDVSMPIEDYKKFLKIADKELPRDIFLQIPKTDKEYKQYFAKLRDCYSTFLQHHETEKHQYHKGIYIDIFPWVFYPKMPKILRKILTRATLRTRYNAIVLSKNIIFNYLIYIICKFIWLLFSLFKSDKLGRTPEDNGYYEAIPRSVLYPLKEMEFEGKFYASPNEAHEYLSLMYGKNYMTPPPLEKRIAHAKVILPNTPCNHPRALSRDMK